MKKVMADNPRTVSEIISGDTPFGIPTNPKGSKKNPIDLYDTENNEHNTRLFYIESSERKVGYINRTKISKNSGDIDAIKVFIPEAYGAGETFPHKSWVFQSSVGLIPFARNHICMHLLTVKKKQKTSLFT